MTTSPAAGDPTLRGFFITFEGGEGSGKTTQARRLVERLRDDGRAARFTREPGGTPLANAIRALLLHPDASLRALAAAHLLPDDGEPVADPILPITEALLFSAARAQHVARIRAWLAAGEVVVSDRFADATRAYQGAARALDPDLILAAERMATGGLRPDLTLLLDLSAEDGLRRARARASQGDQGDQNAPAGDAWNRLDAEALAFHERVRAGYLALAQAEPARVVTLSAAEPRDTLAARIWQVVEARLAPAAS